MKWATLLIADRRLSSGSQKCFGVIFDMQRVPDDFPVCVAGCLTWHPTEEFGGTIVTNVIKPEHMTPDQEKAWEFALSFAENVLRHGYIPDQQTFDWSRYLFT